MELKAGYLVELESLGQPRLCVIQYSILDELVCSSPSFWVEVDMLDDDLEIKNTTLDNPIRINRVWGRAYGHAAYDLTIGDRDLLWERKCKYCQNQN